MAKTQIKFKTVLSSLTKGGKPCYSVRGGFAKTTEKWNPAKHSLHLVINLKGALKEKMADIEFVNVSEGIKVTLYSVGDEIWAEDGVIAGTAGETVKIVCDNGKILAGREERRRLRDRRHDRRRDPQRPQRRERRAGHPARAVRQRPGRRVPVRERGGLMGVYSESRF